MHQNHVTQLPDPLLIQLADDRHAPALRQLWTLFRHDMSSITGALPDRRGRYREERLENALACQPGWQAWIMTAAEHPIGFAIARALDEPIHVLSSLFVVLPARREGVGTRLATTVLRAHPGTWRIAYQPANAPAARFWPRVAAFLDPAWTCERLQVPGRPELPPDAWIQLTVPGTPSPRVTLCR